MLPPWRNSICLDCRDIDQRFTTLARLRVGQAEALEKAEVFRAAPPEVWQRDVALLEAETAAADHVEVAVGAFLHVHGMTEQQPDHPRFDVRVGGFGEQQ